MGKFNELKITQQELAANGMTSLRETRWKDQAEFLKAKLDGDGTFVAGRLGQVLDAMEASTAAASLGADVASVATKNVQAVLNAFEAGIAARYTSTQADALVATNTNDLVKNVTFNDQDGKFTITKKDGTAVVIDTILEKVPVSMVFETVGGVTRIKLTNQDGSTSFADVSALVDGYTFGNTDTVSLSVTGVGNQKTIYAAVRDASLGIEKLTLTAVTTLQGYVSSSGNSATAAANSATAATNKASEAITSATNASTAANTATERATVATAAAASAASDMGTAVAAMAAADTYATNASASATAASTSATSANSAATNAANSVAGFDAKVTAANSNIDTKTATFDSKAVTANSTIDGKVTTATTKASEAAASATTASTAASTAATHATTATTKAQEAATSAATAASTTAGITADANKAQSYAVGGTGTRTGENTDNSKYWCEQSRAIATGDVPTRTEAQGYVSAHATNTYAHKQGVACEQEGANSNAEGNKTSARGASSHAEGVMSISRGGASHAEGSNTSASGTASHAEGSFTQATGNYSHAQNEEAIAQGRSQTALGRFNVAQGTSSTYEATDQALIIGNGTAYNARSNAMTVTWEGTLDVAKDVKAAGVSLVGHASDKYLHKQSAGCTQASLANAEGANCKATAFASHAEGNGTETYGNYAHAEGDHTGAVGANSHAEGLGTEARGTSSHSEGGYTSASGFQAHAEGAYSLASGGQSHAEGLYTGALSYYAHAEGKSSFAAHGTIYNITAYDNTDKTITLDLVTGLSVGDSLSIRVLNSSPKSAIPISAINGTVVTLTTNETISSAWLQAVELVSTQYPTHAEGDNTMATGGYSHAEGNSTNASGDSSHSEGLNTVASGLSSHSEGVSNTAAGVASHAEGSNNVAATNTSHIEGECNLASVGSVYKIVAFDDAAKTITLESVTNLAVSNMLDIKIANAKALSGVGISAINGLVVTLATTEVLTSNWKHAIKQNTATTYAAHAEGRNVISSANGAHAEGISALALGAGAHAEGGSTTASVAYSHAEGSVTMASGSVSHAEGGSTTASGAYAHSEGNGTTASGAYAHSEGGGTTASGMYTHSQNKYTLAQGYAQTAIGEYNVAQGTVNSRVVSDQALIVGNGTSDAARSNAMSLTWEGTLDVAKDVTVNGVSLKTYDRVIRTQAEFDALVASPTWLDAKSVCFIGDGGTLKFTKSDGKGCKIPQTVKQIQGMNSAIIEVTSFSYDASTNPAGLWYATLPTSKDYAIDGLSVNCTGAGVGLGLAFNNCTQLTNCFGSGFGTGDSGYGYGFLTCTQMTNCIGTGNSVGASGSATGFENCTQLTNCNGYGACTGTSIGFATGFHSCTQLINCIGIGTGNTGNGRGFHSCNQLSNCTGTGTGTSTGYGFLSCSYLSTCKRDITTASTTALLGGTSVMSYTVTLLASKWSGASAPYTQTYSNSAILSTYTQIDMVKASGTTAAQLAMLQSANIQGGTQAVGSIVLEAWGNKPTLDLSVQFIIRGDM